MKDITLIENEPKQLQDAMNEHMEKGIKHFEGELIKIRTGRAHTSLVEDIMVDCYGGSPMPIKNVAALSAPDVRMIIIQPWDNSTIPAIEKALKQSDVGITPMVDGNIIRLTLPEMSSSRREELVKILSRKLEECKVTLRNVRKDFNNLIRDAKKDKKISENFFNRLSDIVQEITDKWIAQADAMAKKKETEVKTI